MIFSDAIHQLRSTLDNLAWGLAHLRDAMPSKPRGIQFPITSDAKDWPSEARRIAELPVAARVAIETVQPFQRTHVGERAEQDGLLLLNSLNTVDKHRILIQPTVNPLQISHSFSISFRDELEAGRDYDPPDVTLSADLFATEATLVVQRTKTPIESVEGDYHVTAQVVVEDPVHGAARRDDGVGSAVDVRSQSAGSRAAGGRGRSAVGPLDRVRPSPLGNSTYARWSGRHNNLARDRDRTRSAYLGRCSSHSTGYGPPATTFAATSVTQRRSR